MRALAVMLVASLAILATPAEAAKPKRAAVLRAITQVQKQTHFAKGRRAARTARRAFARGKACRAAKALSRHHTLAARRRLRALDARSVKTRMLVLRSRPKGKGCGGKPTVAVDTSIKPSPDLPDGTPVATVVDADGTRVDFAANDLVISGSLADAEAAFTQVEALGEGLYRVKVDPPRANPTRMATDLAALGGKSRGAASTVSSQDGLDMIAAAAAAARKNDDLTVGLNFVLEGASLAGGSAIEDPRGPDGFADDRPGWNPDPFHWKFLTQTGVPQAWQLMARSGRTRNKVGLAVLDMGFSTQTNQPDFGSPLTAFSNVPFNDALNNPNKLSCGSGNPCPWHGTNVANTAFSVVDDNHGVAGTGGPVANRIVVYTLYDFVTSIQALFAAQALGARVVNMSYGAPVPYYLAWSVLPFEIATASAKAAGVTLVASAGNDKRNVDAEDCFIVCWEEAWVTPCENAGVICVGALEKDGTNRASYSNYGGEQVDIFAPGTVLVGFDPATNTSAGRTAVHSVNGTSFAAPYLAGVAALLRAAGASRGTTESVLKSTASVSSDNSVKKYVNTLAAVQKVLPRLVNIETPKEGDQLSKGGLLTFEAFAFDPGGASPTISWTSNGSPIGTGATILADLPYGPAEIRATATFPSGGSVSDTRRIIVTNTPPTLDITQPGDGATFFQGEQVPLRSAAGDSNQVLRADQIVWRLDGTQFGTGENPTLDLAGVAVGAHTVSATATDDAGATAGEAITVNVATPPPNLPPTVAITSPADGAVLTFEPGQDYGIANFQADVSDPEGDALTYTWTEQLLPGGAITTRSMVEDPGPQQVHFAGCSGEGTKWTLTVSDGTNSRTDAVTLFFDVVC